MRATGVRTFKDLRHIVNRNKAGELAVSVPEIVYEGFSVERVQDLCDREAGTIHRTLVHLQRSGMRHRMLNLELAGAEKRKIC